MTGFRQKLGQHCAELRCSAKCSKNQATLKPR
jgi:hypothetical protein